MGKLNKFQIVFGNQNQVFHPGQAVSGHVILEVKGNLKLREIKGRLQGYADVHWTEERQTQNESDQNESHTETIHYRAHETYFDQRMVIFGKGHGQKGDIVLKPGLYSFPFSATLPQGIPSSYEAQIGRVRYVMKATIDRPWAFDDKTKTFFTVSNLFDLNTRPELMNGASATDQEVLCCLCCASGPIIAKVSLARQGYVPGEAIIIDAEIDNRSNRTLKCSKAKLIMFTVDPGMWYDLDILFEVVIGSIPFASIAQQYGSNIPAAIEPAPSGAHTGLNMDTSMPRMPPLTYAENAMGRVSTREDDNDEHTTGSSNYATVYSYYNWGPSSNFSI